MWQRSTAVFCSLLTFAAALPARTVQDSSCGTHVERGREELFLHARSRAAAKLRPRALAADAAATSRDYGDIAVMSEGDGVVSSPNTFDLAGKSIRFAPAGSAASSYRVQVSAGSFDSDAATQGESQTLGDDDARLVSLPFAFPFYGKTYSALYINSDGNATFGEADASSTERSLGRVTAGPPRIAPLFTDLDPRTGAVRVLSEPARVVLTWDHVPPFSSSGPSSSKQTFQARLYPDGAIEFAYGAVDSGLSAVVGIAPGFLAGSSSVVHFSDNPAQEFAAAVVERFTTTYAVDMVTVAQKFYSTHQDAYDYLVAYNTRGIQAASGAVAYEVTVRNDRTGYGDIVLDNGAQYGSPRRLQSIINMGPLMQYPDSPTAKVSARGATGDTPVTVVAHEAGHLFLAFASAVDPNGSISKPMLNSRNLAHWAFTFNSDASLLEGNRIRDNGAGTDPRFTTTATVQGYSSLDQYLMGFRAPEEVEDTFMVMNSPVASSRLPLANYSFNGERVNVSVRDIIDSEGRRTPDHTVSQRRFRFAFILIVPDGQEPSAADLAKVEAFRSEFEKFYATATGNRAVGDATLRKAVQFSGWPALGVVAGATAPATISIAEPAASPLTFTVESRGSATAPTVVIPAGQTSATLIVSGLTPGVDALTFKPDDGSFETIQAQVQVSDSTSPLSLQIVSGDRQVATGDALPQPIGVKVLDQNRLPYPGVAVTASVTGGGSLDSPSAVTDENGVARFRWTPAVQGPNTLVAALPGRAVTAAATALGRPAVRSGGVANAASYTTTLAPGAIAAVFGDNLAAGVAQAAQALPLSYTLGSVRATVNDVAALLYYVSDSQVNLVLPQNLPQGQATIAISSLAGTTTATVNVAGAQPGLFYNPANGFGSILVANTSATTDAQPVRAGDVVSIYCTGLGATERRGELDWTVARTDVQIGGKAAEVQFSGLNPVYPGLYQINAVVPSGLAPGVGTAQVFVNGVASNEVKLALQ